jgi:hypothetical protein
LIQKASKPLRESTAGFTNKVGMTSGSREGEFGLDRRVFETAVRTARLASLRTGPERLLDDGLDGAGATAAFRRAAETAIDLLGVAGKVASGADGMANIVIAEDVTGTDNHQNWRTFVMRRHRYVSVRRDAKGKAGF